MIFHRERLHYSPVEPLDLQIEFIPWTCLKHADHRAVERAVIQLGLHSLVQSSSWKVWKASTLSHALLRTLYITEDLFAHHVLGDYRHPGLLLDGQLLFRYHELDRSMFCEDLRDFWATWVRHLFSPQFFLVLNK